MSGPEQSNIKAYAHSIDDQPLSRWEPLSDHLADVATLAQAFAGKFGASDWGFVAGALHDLGKLSTEFQARLRGAPSKVDHATAGAREAARLYGVPGHLLAYAIAGHHAGLADWDGDGHGLSTLERRLDANKTTIPKTPGVEMLRPTTSALAMPRPSSRKGLPPAMSREGTSMALFVRMIFSSLVDADRLATEAFYRRAEGRGDARRGGWKSLDELKEQIDHHMMSRFTLAADASAVSMERASVLAAARRAAQEPQGLFSLTVPTGGGKTLASLAFALDHAVTHKLDRIIYVIPFTSIIDQTARVFRAAVGPALEDHIIEHHSATRDDDPLSTKASVDESALQAGERRHLATENWDAPIVVTTAVQFFESLFSNKTSKCRKLHNIARSVVVMDEVQTLPVPLLRPTLAVIEDLATHYGTSVVLCTATQPSINATRSDGAAGLPGGIVGVREIVERPETLYATLQRVTVRACISLSSTELADQLSSRDRVLCIVATRANARDLYKALRDKTGGDGLFHLSALMCPAHRMAKLDEIKAALASGRPCRVVATTVVEAGVDIDFPIVWRQMAGLDSIAQAAGRCNREGKQSKADAIIQLFEVPDWKGLKALRRNEDCAREILRQPKFAADPLGLAAIEAYFEQLYDRNDLDENGILGLAPRWRKGMFPFAEIASLYRIIDDVMEPVIIPWGEDATAALAALGDPALAAEDIRKTARRLQPYIVNIPKGPFADLKRIGRLAAVNPHRFDEQFMQLTPEAFKDIYADDFGFDWSDPTYRSAEANLL